MARIDYLNDPDAPKANSVVPAVSAIVTDAQDRILLILRTDNGYWSIPGGGLKPGESIADATVREVREETGIDCQRNDMSDPACLLPDLPHVRPARPQRRQEPLGTGYCP
jgi:8-oxo-dGTP pyrophosphatase MutT (NUDIX family)